MFQFSAVAEAVADLCRGAARLRNDTDGTDLVSLGSNRIFAVGDQVEVSDCFGQRELRTVVATSGLHSVRLDGPISGMYLVGNRASVRLVGDVVPALAWVNRGVPELLPELTAARFPCAIVAPRQLVQSDENATNRAVSQDYTVDVYYIRARRGAEAEETALLEEVGKLFNIIMSDPYLGGTCWHSRVDTVAHDREIEQELRERGTAVRCMRLAVRGRALAVCPE